ncbi:MAG: hypothetical protein GY949_04315 [Gammaproteobacteria bacterium]|nr:hypothetical protein [Gammaproteobacteria bacterium]
MTISKTQFTAASGLLSWDEKWDEKDIGDNREYVFDFIDDMFDFTGVTSPEEITPYRTSVGSSSTAIGLAIGSEGDSGADEQLNPTLSDSSGLIGPNAPIGDNRECVFGTNDGDVFVIDASNDITLYALDGDDKIVVGSRQGATARDNVVYGGDGNDEIGLFGMQGGIVRDNVVYGDDGNDGITLAANLGGIVRNNTVHAGDGNDKIKLDGGMGNVSHNTVSAGNGNDTISFDANFGKVTWNTIYAGNGDDTIIMDDSYHGQIHNNTVYGGDGNDTFELRGGGGISSLYGTQHNYLYGGAGNDTFRIDGEDNFVFGGIGDDTFYLDSTRRNWLSWDQNHAQDWGGHDVVYNFNENGARSYIALGGIIIGGEKVNNFNQLKDHMSQDGDDVFIDFGDGNSIRLVGVELDELTGDRFEVLPGLPNIPQLQQLDSEQSYRQTSFDFSISNDHGGFDILL